MNLKIVHVSFRRAAPGYTDPWQWIKFLSFFTGILEKLAQSAEVVAIHHIDFRGDIVHNGVRYYFPKLRWGQLVFPLKFNATIRAMRPDVVVVHGLIFPVQILMLRAQLPQAVRIIGQHHAERPLRHPRKLFQWLADRYIDAYLFSAQELGVQWVQEGLIGKSEKICEVMEASSSFSPMEKAEAQAITGVSGQRVFLWVGRLDANKDPITLVKAFIAFSRTRPDAVLYIIFQTDELLDDIQAILDADVCRSIHLVGQVDHEQLRYWYASADYIVSTSHYEGSGIAVCEGMSCGCIPVLTDIPSFRMMTDRGRIGILFTPGRHVALQEALTKVTALDIGRERLKVLTWFKGHLSFDAIASEIFRLAEQITQQP